MIYETFIQNYNRIDFLYEHLISETQLLMISEGFNLGTIKKTIRTLFEKFVKFLNELIFRIRRFLKMKPNLKEDLPFTSIKISDKLKEEFEKSVNIYFIKPFFGFGLSEYTVLNLTSTRMLKFVENYKNNGYINISNVEIEIELASDNTDREINSLSKSQTIIKFEFIEKEIKSLYDLYKILIAKFSALMPSLKKDLATVDRSIKLVETGLENLKKYMEKSIKSIDDLDTESTNDKLVKLIQFVKKEYEINQKNVKTMMELVSYLGKLKKIYENYYNDGCLLKSEITSLFRTKFILKELERYNQKYKQQFEQTYKDFVQKIGANPIDNIWEKEKDWGSRLKRSES